jgi:hypothetical protein
MNRRPVIVSLSLAALSAVLAACGSSSTSSNAPAPAPSHSPAASPTPSPVAYTYGTINPASFTDHITNPYLPWRPGTTYIFHGTRDGKPMRIEVTVTKQTKVIMGVKCLVIRDIVTGALEEQTTDWYAQDSKGNVWYFGEDTKELTNGVVTSTQGTWEAGVNGALPGIVMYAHPTPGAPYLQEYRPGIAEDMAQVVQAGLSVKVAAGHFGNVIVTKDTDPLNPSKLEHKYYAPGVGMVKSTGVVNGHTEILQLAQVLKAR